MLTRLAFGAATLGAATTGMYAHRLHRQLHTDPLTGLANRAALTRAFRQRQRRAGQGELVGLLLVDLDRFKQINDTHGHQFGDHVLRSIATSLRHATADGELAVRLHGDEFAVLLPNLAEVRDAEARARVLRARLAEPRAINGQPITATASIGAAVDTTRDTTLPALLHWADSRMYSTKTTRTVTTLTSPPTHAPRLRDQRKDAA